MFRTAGYGTSAAAVVGRAIHRSVIHRRTAGHASLSYRPRSLEFCSITFSLRTPSPPPPPLPLRPSLSLSLSLSFSLTFTLALVRSWFSPRGHHEIRETRSTSTSQRILDRSLLLFAAIPTRSADERPADEEALADPGLTTGISALRKRHCHSGKLPRLTEYVGPCTLVTTSLCTTTRITVSMTIDRCHSIRASTSAAFSLRTGPCFA